MTELGYAEAHDTSIEERYTAVPLLKGKVIVISGIGPGLGRSLADRVGALAEGVGFEPTVHFHAHTLSKRAP